MLYPRTVWNGTAGKPDKRTADLPLGKLWQKVLREFQGLRVWECAVDGLVTCCTCGGEKRKKYRPNHRGIHGGHWITRTNRNCALLDMNVHGQCYACNCFLNGNPARYERFIRKTYGIDAYHELLETAAEDVNLKILDKDWLLDFHQHILAEQRYLEEQT